MQGPSLPRKHKEDVFGKRYENSTLSNLWWSKDLIEKVYEWTKKPNRMLVMLGSPGTGKTHLCAALWEWWGMNYKSHTSRHWRERDLLSKIKKSFDLIGDSADELKELINDVYVSLDDVGADSITEWSYKQIAHFIDIRYEMMGATVITSNFSMREISEKIGSRTASRLLSKENIIIDLFAATDFRINPPEKESKE